MAANLAVSVVGLGKRYTIHHQDRVPYDTVRDATKRTVVAGLNAIRNGFRLQKPTPEEFWALKDVSFDVNVGDVVGIIGRNGAGKSTLLKVLSRITEPTAGQIRIAGRVASLLEVGTGFHPELTGRENIFLNGAILGMSRDEIRSRFDEMVDFAEVEKFLDTPVKRYSSGMYMRLAFSVAAHLEPEILIVDEVLAVGDAAFQRKCLGKMSEIAGHGRTVLFVSHNMNAMERLCNKAIVLKNGSVRHAGNNVTEAIAIHLQDGRGDGADDAMGLWRAKPHEAGRPADHVRLDEMRIEQSDEFIANGTVGNDSEIRVTLQGEIVESTSALTIGAAVFTSSGDLLFWTYSTDGPEHEWPQLKQGVFKLSFEIPARFLNEGRYRVEYMSSLHFQRWIQAPASGGPAVEFQVRGGLSDSPIWTAARPGALAPILEWKRYD